ncbi:transposase [Cyclobacterium amurskyense]|uniref:transposase n=1 Tax=Cyclobacterium amurskyense TaxID=320787 RepID=UPI0030D72D1E|tara:strand:- start:729 stop:1358 length:630 start_codon:yes stop_codon:yes gene_type:complete
MSKYNPNIHHRRSFRLKGYDYSQAGLYFITICFQSRISRFGEVIIGEMILNECGEIAHNEWLNTPKIRTNVELGEFVIMPNHIHGIIEIHDRGELNSPVTKELNSPATKESHSPVSKESHERKGVCNTPPYPIPQQPQPPKSPSNNIGAIVRGYKSSVTRQIGLLGIKGKLWQRNYYEHIIRDEKAFQNISEYIKNNPIKWMGDKFYLK